MSTALAALYRVAEEHNEGVLDARLRAAANDSAGRRVYELDTAEALPDAVVRHGVVPVWMFRRFAPEDQEALWGGPPPEVDRHGNLTRLPIPGCVTPLDLAKSIQW